MKRAKAFFGTFVIALLTTTVGAVTLENNRFVVTQGDKYPMLVYDQNPDVAFEVRSWGARAWWVVVASTRGTCYVAAATVGEEVVDAPFEHPYTNIDSGLQDVFRFQFRWQYRESGETAIAHYGWVSLVTNHVGEVSVLASQVADVHGLAVVGQGEPENPEEEEKPASVTFTAEFFGEADNRYAVLAPFCIDRYASGRIVIPPQIEGTPLVGVGEAAFYSYRDITSVEIPDSIKYIDRKAFCNCSNLQKVLIPSSVESIGEEAFIGCRNLVNCLLPSSITNLGTRAFYDSGILNLTLPGSLKTIPESAFEKCQSLAAVVIRDGTEIISTNAFLDCSQLGKVSIPESIRKIEKMAFAGTRLTQVVIPLFAEVAADAFPKGCTIQRTPLLRINGTTFYKVDPETTNAICQTLLPFAELCKGKASIRVMRENAEGTYETKDAVYACAHLGIAPNRINTYEENPSYPYIDFFYRMPTVKILAIDFDKTHTLTGQVLPAEGTSIVAKPLTRAFGFSQLIFDPWSQDTYWGDDFGVRFLYDAQEGFVADFGDYISSNGIFRLTFPNWCAEMKDPQPAHLFKIILRDHDNRLW